MFKGGGGGGGRGARVSKFFPQRIQIKNKRIFVGWGGGGVRWGVDGWTDKQAQTNLPLQLLRSLGHNTALMYK